MKKTFQVIALFSAFLLYAQNVSDYQYITTEYTKFKTNRFGLESLLANELKKKNYTVISENKNDWNTELQQNPCNILTAEVQNTSSMFRNKVTLNFKDCNDKILFSSEGKSLIKDFESGMQDALKDALKAIKTSNPTAREWTALKETKPTITETLTEKVETIVQNTSVAEPSKTTNKNTTTKAEIYSNGSITLNKINLSNGEFILVNPNNSVPFATFKPSAKKDVFRVQLQDGTATLGYLEAGKILVEIPNADGSFKTETFLKK